MRKSILGSLSVAAACALWMMACGGGGGTTGSGGATGSTTSTTSTTATTSTTGMGGSSTTAGTGGMGGMMSNCTELTVTKAVRSFYDEAQGVSVFTLTLGSMLGGALEDRGQLEFYDLTVSGTVDLSAGDEANYATCTTCTRLLEDIDPMGGAAAKVYFQQGGTLELGASTLPAITGSLKDVTLIEVTIDPMTFESTPVDGGACYHITKADFAFDPAPAIWSCDPGAYSDHAFCDCGDCGVKDPDCTDATNAVHGCVEGQTCATGIKCEGVPTGWTCDAAKYNGGAGNGCDCACGAVDPDCDLMGEPVKGCAANEVCGAGNCIPAGWTCDATFYKDGTYCDCACGVLDPDCADPNSMPFGCLDGQTCPSGLKCEGVPTAWTCPDAKYNGGAGNGCDCKCGAPDPDCDLVGEAVVGCAVGEKCGDDVCIPAAWTCKPAFFADNVCDCGCGVLDTDCADAKVGSCAFCDDTGSCNTMACPGTINPINNAVCN